MDDYCELHCYCGDIENAVNMLLDWNKTHVDQNAKYDFNGHWLYSDTVTMDNAYLEIIGKTKEDWNKERQKWIDEYNREKAEHISKIPELAKEWIEKGHKVLDEKYWNLWDECVPARLSDLYQGMELGACLEIVIALNSWFQLSHAKQLIENQDHSGMSYSLVKSMVQSFCDRGNDFAEYIKM